MSIYLLIKFLMFNAQNIIQKTKDDYNSIASHFSMTRERSWPDVEELLSYVPKRGSVLDMGCGNGRVCNMLSSKEVNYIGHDLSENLVDIARKRCPMQKFEVWEMSKFHPRIQNLDAVLMIASLQHVPSRKLRLDSLRNAYKYLKPGGYLLMTNWNLYQQRFWHLFLTKYAKKPLWGFKDLIVPWKDQDGNILANRYYHAFTVAEITKLVKKVGFRIVEVKKEKNIVLVAQKML